MTNAAKIYFAGSITAGRSMQPFYAEIIRWLCSYGEVLTTHIGSSKLTSAGEDMSAEAIHDRDVVWLLSANLVVADVTIASDGVGYELGRIAQIARAPVILLHRYTIRPRVSSMLTGSSHFAGNVIAYDELHELWPQLAAKLKELGYESVGDHTNRKVGEL